MYPYVNLPVTAKLSYVMKKELTAGTQRIPAAPDMNVASKTRELVNRILPEDCRIKTRQDAWYAAAIGSVCLTFAFPPAVALAAYCIHRAKKEGGER